VPDESDDDRTELAGDERPKNNGHPNASDFAIDSICFGTKQPFNITTHYRIEGEVARGGIGVILKACDVCLQREIAIKILRDDHQYRPETRRRFIEEARITGRLQHPGIIPIYEWGQLSDGKLYFTMGLVKGETLAAQLAGRKDPKQELPRFLKIFEKICQTVAYAHGEGIIHRDLKPSNVLVAPFGVVKVMDWGVAKVLGDRTPTPPQPDARQTDSPPSLPFPEEEDEDEGDSITQVGTVLGTPAYMAPEQARGEIESLDYRADVFGLGAILYKVLTNQPPYSGKNANRVHRKAMRADLKEAFARLDACQAHPELVSITRSCLAADPQDRPADAGQVAQKVTAHLESDVRRAEQDMVRFFDLCLDLFCIAGLNGFFYRINSNFTRILGYSTEEMLSRPFLDFVHHEDRDATLAEMAKLSMGLPVVRFRNRYRDIRGDYHCFEWTAKSDPTEGIIFAVARVISG
jgi:serine/threonine-protein kinase